jgi:hypothetical protein
MSQVLRIMLIFSYSRLKLKMLVKRVRLYQRKGSVGLVNKKDIQKELSLHQTRYIIYLQFQFQYNLPNIE